MNKLIKMAVATAGIGAMLGFTGCGDGAKGPLEEFQALQAKAIEMGMCDKARADKNVDRFKTLSIEEQKKALEQFKRETGIK